MKTVFSYNRHPSYQYLLSYVDAEFLIAGEWGSTVRPHPDNVTFISNEDIPWALEEADIWLSHLITPDLLKFGKFAQQYGWPERIVQIMHGRRQRADHVQNSLFQTAYRSAKRCTVPVLKGIRHFTPIEYVYISDYVADSWPMDGTIIYPGVPTEEFTSSATRSSPPLTVGNDLDRPHFANSILSQLRTRYEIQICGSNDTIESSFLSWSELKHAYGDSVCYLNLLKSPENSFNLATVEAMAAGCPVVTLPHPRSIFSDGNNAVVCRGVDEFDQAIKRLQTDSDYREQLSSSARRTVERRFSMSRFKHDWDQILSGE